MYVYIVAVYKQSGTFKSLYVNLKKNVLSNSNYSYTYLFYFNGS